VGADAFASDLNPIPVLLNMVVLEYIPKYGQRLADEVRQWGAWIKEQAEKELAEFYPKDPDGATPIAYLWARTIRCEGPGCGAEVPLLRGLWLSKKAGRMKALKLVPRAAERRVDVEIISPVRASEVGPGTVKRGAATCPCCGYTTTNDNVRRQLFATRGGTSSARLVAVVSARPTEVGRSYRLPKSDDLSATACAAKALAKLNASASGGLSPVPDESIPTERPSPNARGLSAVTRMGMRTFGDLYAPRQALALATFSRLVREFLAECADAGDEPFREAIASCLSLAVDRTADNLSSLVTWTATGEFQGHTFARQALPIVWDFAEVCPLSHASGNWLGAIDWIARGIEANAMSACHGGTVQQASATNHPLPDDGASALVTDPPYYDAVPYADLSEYFYVWMRRSLTEHSSGLCTSVSVPKDEEAIWNPSRIYSATGKTKDERFYVEQMRKAFTEARRVIAPSGIGVVVFAHKSTAGWEAILSALLEAGWIATASWPIDTEREVRTNAIGTASLSSSVHIVVRPRENPDGSLRTADVGDWRDVLAELPRRIHEWMPRLAEEGVVGADAIFACLGPALEIFSRYSRVEKASGEVVTLREYLEQVWAAVAKEALAQVFKDADTAGFEPDARLTAMWLWTLNAGATHRDESPAEEEESGEEEETKGKAARAKGSFVLEYDAARKIAQGLGAHLEDLDHVVEVSGESARLLTVSERTQHLFGKEQADAPTGGRKKKAAQMDLFGELTKVGADETAWSEKTVRKIGETTLDRVHQAMILFAAGRGEALKRFLVEEGAGRDQRFWRLAQALSALYPASTSEKRWVDGVLARKKGLGL
jgi:adenine-specific DNA methylase